MGHIAQKMMQMCIDLAHTMSAVAMLATLRCQRQLAARCCRHRPPTKPEFSFDPGWVGDIIAQLKSSDAPREALVMLAAAEYSLRHGLIP